MRALASDFEFYFSVGNSFGPFFRRSEKLGILISLVSLEIKNILHIFCIQIN